MAIHILIPSSPKPETSVMCGLKSWRTKPHIRMYQAEEYEDAELCASCLAWISKPFEFPEPGQTSFLSQVNDDHISQAEKYIHDCVVLKSFNKPGSKSYRFWLACEKAGWLDVARLEGLL